MKKGINIWSFPGGTTVEDAIVLAKKAGFDGIELALNERGHLSLESSESEIRSYRQLADEVGIEISSLATGLFWSYSLTSSQPQTRQKAKDIVKKQLEFAAILGVDTILVVPGAVGVDFIPDSEVVPYDQAYDYSLAAITELSKVAEELKVSIGIENVWNKFLLSPLEMRDFIDKVNSPYVGAYFDVGNVIFSGYPEHWIAILNHRIKKVHFKDYRRAAGGLHGFVDLLAGDVNFPEVVKGLQAIGYQDYVIAEMIPGYTHHGNQIINNTSGAMDAILGRK
ncbi:sugar phosphate isomerase/epimerase family protein [Paenibacillus roseipurpureus]|uniref:Sugar phosphate isomerase/epimerase family protein n=1 Tax=Paenibacillus roseopurpureus TaxID=2918901 RepID=A0AA96RLG4_9BACL|nr:sugar phosphate isomerase/epimerase family protein [Paenibacillus sp. MBLB1832]WNR43147.1 sugar phosphate isomerase/epimerase family protein [Paenibacillus sp. MBLB1832]